MSWSTCEDQGSLVAGGIEKTVLLLFVFTSCTKAYWTFVFIKFPECYREASNYAEGS